jgi:hypothetical protein
VIVGGSSLLSKAHGRLWLHYTAIIVRQTIRSHRIVTNGLDISLFPPLLRLPLNPYPPAPCRHYSSSLSQTPKDMNPLYFIRGREFASEAQTSLYKREARLADLWKKDCAVSRRELFLPAPFSDACYRHDIPCVLQSIYILFEFLYCENPLKPKGFYPLMFCGGRGNLFQHVFPLILKRMYTLLIEREITKYRLL